MKEEDFQKVFSRIQNAVVAILVVLFVSLGVAWLALERPDLFTTDPAKEEQSTSEPPLIYASNEDSESLFKEGEHKLLVIANCTGCHSGKLVTQNRATREGWQNMIRWMQETQNLKDLGEDEAKILDYLAEHYAPAAQGRRQNLTVEKWYELE